MHTVVNTDGAAATQPPQPDKKETKKEDGKGRKGCLLKHNN